MLSCKFQVCIQKVQSIYPQVRPPLIFASPNLYRTTPVHYVPVSVPKLELSKKFVGQVSGRGFDISWATASWEIGSLEGEGVCSLREYDTVFLGDLGTVSWVVSLEDRSFHFSALSFHFLSSSFSWSSLLKRKNNTPVFNYEKFKAVPLNKKKILTADSSCIFRWHTTDTAMQDHICVSCFEAQLYFLS